MCEHANQVIGIIRVRRPVSIDRHHSSTKTRIDRRARFLESSDWYHSSTMTCVYRFATYLGSLSFTPRSSSWFEEAKLKCLQHQILQSLKSLQLELRRPLVVVLVRGKRSYSDFIIRFFTCNTWEVSGSNSVGTLSWSIASVSGRPLLVNRCLNILNASRESFAHGSDA